MEQQINLFSEIKLKRDKDVYASIEAIVDEYGIDRYYKKFLTNRTYNFHEIENKLYRLPNYDRYLNKLYEELKKYFKEVDDDYNVGKIGIAKREKIIILYSKRSVGPTYCLSMLKKFIKENLKVGGE